MAWIKVEFATPDKPEISLMAEALNLDQDEVLGKLIRFWMWADQQSIDGDALIVTQALIDRVTLCEGFTEELIKVGWLKAKKVGFAIPNFERHNGESAKRRALTAKRNESYRARKSDAPNVTSSSPDKTRVEKSTEE
jgi:hypothetical protein